MNTHDLTKPRILAGLQCPKRLYLEVHHRELAKMEEPTKRALALGHRVGEVARILWPDGGHNQDLEEAALAETRPFCDHPESDYASWGPIVY